MKHYILTILLLATSLAALAEREDTLRVIGMRDASIGVLLATDADCHAGVGFEGSINNMVAIRWRPVNWTAFTFGTGLGGSYIPIRSGYHIERMSGIICVMPNIEGMKDMHSRIYLGKWMFPLTCRFYPTNKVELLVSVIGVFNYFSKITNSYKSDATGEMMNYSEKLRDLPIRTFTVDLMAGIGLSHKFSAYVKYSPMSLFRGGCGPDMKFVSAGIVLSY